jgi:hypothetical protein
MSATVTLATPSKNAMLAALLTRLDPTPGGARATLEIRSGSKPANGDAAATGTLLAVLTFADPPAPAPSGGVLTFSAIARDEGADATGNAAWARLKNADGGTELDGTVTVTGGGGFVELNRLDLVAGGPVEVTGCQLDFAG